MGKDMNGGGGAKGGGGDTPKTPLHLNEKGSREGHTETQTHTHRDTHTGYKHAHARTSEVTADA